MFPSSKCRVHAVQWRSETRTAKYRKHSRIGLLQVQFWDALLVCRGPKTVLVCFHCLRKFRNCLKTGQKGQLLDAIQKPEHLTTGLGQCPIY